MVKMEKDNRIEEEFRAYTDGAEAPQVDLTAAKNALAPRKKRRGALFAVLSACACLLIAAIAIAAQIPRGGNAMPPASAESYSLGEAQSADVAFTDLEGRADGRLLERLKPYFTSPFASGACTLYYVEGRTDAVLLRAELAVVRGGVRVDAKLFFDLSMGECEAQELGEFRTISKDPKARYAYEVDQSPENGEYLGRAYGTLGGSDLYLSVESSQISATELLARYFYSM